MPAFSSADNFATTLSAAITTTTQTPISVTSATGAPTSGRYVILIDSEQMLVTSGQGSTSWGVTRAYAGTVAATHLNGAAVTLIWTTATLASWGGGDGGVAPGYWPTLSPIGLTGAMSATRWVGGTVSGPPSSGTFLVGDFVVDRSGGLFICTVAGSPGTWNSPSPSYGSSVLGDTGADLTFTGTSPPVTEVHANLRVTVTVPASGRVRVAVIAQCQTAQNACDINLWCAAGGNLAVILAGFAVGVSQQTGANADNFSVSGEGLLTGLTPGPMTFNMGISGVNSGTITIPNHTRNAAANGTRQSVLTLP